MKTVAPTLLLPAIVALASGCTSVLIEPNAVVLGPEPLELVLTPALRTGARTGKGISAPLEVKVAADLPLRGGLRDLKTQRERGVYYKDGRRVSVKAVLLLQGGEQVAVEGDVSGCDTLEMYCDLFFGLDIYHRIVIERIRFTATAPIRVKSIEWEEGPLK